jgi:hypothetical protein
MREGDPVPEVAVLLPATPQFPYGVPKVLDIPDGELPADSDADDNDDGDRSSDLDHMQPPSPIEQQPSSEIPAAPLAQRPPKKRKCTKAKPSDSFDEIMRVLGQVAATAATNPRTDICRGPNCACGYSRTELFTLAGGSLTTVVDGFHICVECKHNVSLHPK